MLRVHGSGAEVTDAAKLSILIPVFNERRTIAEAVRRARTVDLPVDREILIIDDGSTDGTGEIIKRLADSTVKVLTQPVNMGKGAALRRGFEESTGDYVIVYDADLEYDPRDWPSLLRPALEGEARAVYGSRFTGERRNMMFWHWMGNRFLSLLTNLLYNTTLSDMETCSKLIEGDLIRSLHLTSNRFDIEPEITAKLLRLGVRIYEVPIRYTGREVDEGKKISWRDGFPALWALVKYRFVSARSIRP
ncbi:MAG: glycosyltransferase family 2 protein [Acidimicrobiia bacterium]